MLFFFQLPSLFFGLQHSDFVWNYFTEPSAESCGAMKDGRCYWPRGRMLGGSGAANAMLYIRGNRQDFDGWAAMGNTGWSYDEVLPFFELSVTPQGNATHPKGYVSLNPFERHDEDIHRLILAGGLELGLPHVEAFVEGSETGYAHVPGTVRNGHRMSTGKGYLGAVAATRPNLHVVKNARVTKLNLEGDRVSSVSFEKDGTLHRVKVAKEAVLSAGAIDSPALLLRSGIGPSRHLEELGLAVNLDLPGVGGNLQDHVLVPLFLRLDEGQAKAATEQEILDSIYDYLVHRTGPLTTPSTASLVAFINTNASSDSVYPDTENHHLFFQRGRHDSLEILARGLYFQEQYVAPLQAYLRDSHLLCVFVLLSHPVAKGELRLRSTDPREAPILTSNYLTEPEDVSTLLRGIGYIEALEQTKAFQEHSAELAHIPIAECDSLDAGYRSEEYWRCYARYFTVTCYHQSGTVKMGSLHDPAACVSPSGLRLRGLSNLRVADASVMPAVVSANTNAATVMIGERAAAFIREDYYPRSAAEKLPHMHMHADGF